MLMSIVATLSTMALAASPCPNELPQKATVGVPAPCDGWLISEADALFVAQMRADLEAEKKAHATTKKETVGLLDVERRRTAASRRRVGELESALDRCEQLAIPSVPWHEDPAFVGSVSAAAAAIVAVLVVVLVYEVK